jgi:alkanesulfonate monooxygenase SsuD/methylene tetrahydromethanopterin reductase-like flavin-dependent oxidoreductase (luciferase family)
MSWVLPIQGDGRRLGAGQGGSSVAEGHSRRAARAADRFGFGGLSAVAHELAAERADCHITWGEPPETVVAPRPKEAAS